jgi:hypothetical protein
MSRFRLSLLLAASVSTATSAEPARFTPDTGEWQKYVEALSPIGDRLVARLSNPHDDQLRHELYSRLFSAISQANAGLFLGDSEHPEFWPIFNRAHNFGAPNPDGVYYLAPLAGDGIYRISGFRGTSRMVDFQVGGGLFYPRADGPVAPSFHNYDLDSIDLGPDGRFEVILSGERPDGYLGNWWHIKPQSTYVMVRQWAYDWVNEIDGRFAIERLDTPALRPRRTLDDLKEDLEHVASWTEHATEVSMAIANRYRQTGLVNKVMVRDLSEIGGFSSNKQVYVEGQFDIQPDEALIYETSIPDKCRYWGVQLTDLLSWGAIDYMNRQSSLNGFSAHLDRDGKFRAVIAMADPGVPNWLDTGGYRRGAIFGRWTQCSNQPAPKVTKVKLTDVRHYLPGDTPVINSAERDRRIRLRREGAQLRRRW